MANGDATDGGSRRGRSLNGRVKGPNRPANRSRRRPPLARIRGGDCRRFVSRRAGRCGLPGVGKTTVAKRVADHVVVDNSGDRAETFAQVDAAFGGRRSTAVEWDD